MANHTYPLTPNHLQAFGGIVQMFARFERLVEITTSALLGANYGACALAMASLSYSAKCDALLSLVGVIDMDQRLKDRIVFEVKRFNEFAVLRNAIAHHVWREGSKPGTVKPFTISSRGGKGKVKGLSEDETEYELDDLYRIGNTLIAAHDAFRDFLISSGFTDHMGAQTDPISAASSSADHPSK